MAEQTTHNWPQAFIREGFARLTYKRPPGGRISQWITDMWPKTLAKAQTKKALLLFGDERTYG
jgi:hypothetical protein